MGPLITLVHLLPTTLKFYFDAFHKMKKNLLKLLADTSSVPTYEIRYVKFSQELQKLLENNGRSQ